MPLILLFKRIVSSCVAVIPAIFAVLSLPLSAAVVTHSGTISQNTLWSADDVHWLTGDVVVNPGVTLTIEAGTVVKFSSSSELRINGVLSAVGSAAERIIFTSYRDDTHGGDTNDDGMSSGQAGDWQYIRFTGSITDSLTRMEYVDVLFGGSSTASVLIESSAPVIEHAEVSHSTSGGIYVSGWDATPTLSTLELSHINGRAISIINVNGVIPVNNNQIDHAGTGIYIQNAAANIENNSITDNREWGIYFNSTNAASPVLKNNVITNNHRGVRLPIDTMPNTDDGNTLVPNDQNGVWLLGGSRSSDIRFNKIVSGNDELNTYHFNSFVTIPSEVSMQVDPGVIFKFSSGGMNIDGELSAEGTAEDLIIFTSEHDDMRGGDFNNNGYSTIPKPGDWSGINFRGSGSGDQRIDASVMDHVVVNYAGVSNNASMYVSRADIAIRNSSIAYSSGRGLYISQSDLTLENNEVYANAGSGIYLTSAGNTSLTQSKIYANGEHGIDVRSSAIINVSNSEIFANLNHAINTDSSGSADAADNWWGASDGPSGDGPGLGDSISGNVDITTLLLNDFKTQGTAYSYVNAGPNQTKGTLPAPTIVQGQASDEWGSSASQSILFDVNSVIMDYAGLDNTKNYTAIFTDYNPDSVSVAGGTTQRLLADTVEVVNPLPVSTTTPSPHRYRLPSSAFSDSHLRLSFVLEQGFRASVSQLWLIEENTTDINAPTVQLTQLPGQLTGGHYTVEGTAVDLENHLRSVEVGIDAGNGIIWYPVSELNSDGRWKYRWNLPADGDYQLYSRAIDDTGNTGETSLVQAVTIDQTPSAAATGLFAFDTPQDNGSSISLDWLLSADDTELSAYEIYRRIEGDASFTLLGSVAAGIDQFIDNTATTGISYEYQLASLDVPGNRTYSSVSSPARAIDNTLADTIAPEEIDNLQASPGNEFVFLNWELASNTALDQIDQLLDISTDGGATWGSSGPNYNDGGTISLGLIASNYLVDNLSNETNYLFRIRTRDSASPSNTSQGVQTGIVTPSESAFTTISSNITQDTVWAAGVYYLDRDISINNGATLTIEPGVIVKFASSRQLTVVGQLFADGVVFTSWSDDEHGGDTNGDGASTGEAGDWRYLYFPNATDASRISNSTVRYAGTSTAAIYITNGNGHAFINNRIEHSNTHGIYQSTAVNTQYNGNTITDSVNYGLYIYSGSASVSGNTLSRNAHGFGTRFMAPSVFENNTLTANRGYGLYMENTYDMQPIENNLITGNDIAFRLPFSALPVDGSSNTLIPNTRGHIEVLGNTRHQDLSIDEQWPLIYVVSGNPRINTGYLMTMSGGSIMKFGSGSELDIAGALYAVGDAANRIVFTSYRDDSVGGDTNGDGPSVGQAGDWDYIGFGDSVIDFATRLEYADIRYGGDRAGSLYLSDASPTITQTRVQNSDSNGLYITGGSSLPVIDAITVEDIAGHGVYIGSNNTGVSIQNSIIRRAQTGIYLQNAVASIEGNTITDNSEWGVYYHSVWGTPTPLTNNTIINNRRSLRVPPDALPDVDDNNVLLPNEQNGLWIISGNRNEDMQWNVLSENGEELNTYHINGTLSLVADAVMTINPGVVVKFANNSYLNITGALQSLGEENNPIVFTSERDDQYGGDFNNDGNATSPYSGSWRGIELSGSGSIGSTLAHTVIRYGGSSTANLYLNSSEIDISNSTISQSNSYGIYSYRSTVNVRAS